LAINRPKKNNYLRQNLSNTIQLGNNRNLYNRIIQLIKWMNYFMAWLSHLLRNQKPILTSYITNCW